MFPNRSSVVLGQFGTGLALIATATTLAATGIIAGPVGLTLYTSRRSGRRS